MRAPDPGTGQAVGLGCTCPVTDNHNGDGYRGGNGLRWDEGGRYVIYTDCPIHTSDRDRGNE